MKSILSILILLFCCCMVFSRDIQITYIRIYSKFLRNGSTANIRNAFMYPNENNIDTTSNNLFFIMPQDLNNALNSASISKHFQSKLGGITFAGEFLENNNKHFFIYFEDSKLLIDITDNKKYRLKSNIILQRK